MHRLLPIAIFLAFLALYVLSVGTPFYSSDAVVMYESTRAIALDGHWRIPDLVLPQIVRGADGYTYSKYDPGMALLATPLVQHAENIAKTDTAERYALGAIYVMVVPAAAMALAIAALFTLAQEKYGTRRGVMVAAVAGLATMAWPYGRLFFAEAVVAGALTTAVAAIALPRTTRGRWIGVGIAALMMGIAILTRASALIYVLPVLYLLWEQHRPRALWPLAALLMIGPALAFGGLLWHNAIRFENPLQFGYGDERFSLNPLPGITGLLVSPGKSVFIYAPPLIISGLLWPRFRQREPSLARSLLIMTGLALLYYGAWWAWHGGWVWGPRFLVPLMPLWCLAWGELVSMRPRHLWYTAGLVIFALGLGVQIIGTFTQVTPVYRQAFAGESNHDDGTRFTMVHYDLDYWPLSSGIDQFMTGEHEPQAIYNLADTGLAANRVRDIPARVHQILGLSLLVISWISWRHPRVYREQK